VTFLAAVNHTGKSSMEVGIKVISENIRTRAQRHVNSCFFTMVAVDEDGRPANVPPLQPAAGDEQRRFERPVLRKNLRLELANRCT
jgi:acyl-CoA hydrolase